MEESVVKVEHLSHRYNVQWAIKDINFEIKRKRTLGLLGSNGAGKSTTMNIMCGVLNQTEGEVYINGINLREHPVEAKKHIGFLPQKPPLYPDLTVDEYLTHCALMRQMDKSQVKTAVEKAKSRCGIAHFSKRLIRNLSGGYQQRVGIAQAIVHIPNLSFWTNLPMDLIPTKSSKFGTLSKKLQQSTLSCSPHIFYQRFKPRVMILK